MFRHRQLVVSISARASAAVALTSQRRNTSSNNDNGGDKSRSTTASKPNTETSSAPSSSSLTKNDNNNKKKAAFWESTPPPPAAESATPPPSATPPKASNSFLDRLAQLDEQQKPKKQKPSSTVHKNASNSSTKSNEGGTTSQQENASGEAEGEQQQQQQSADEKESFVRRAWHKVSDLTGNAVPAPLTASQTRKEQTKEVIREERKKLLVFRNVGMDLDRAILSRDVFLIPKYFRLGMDFAVDNELERMLRFFNEHAINEMKIIYEGKLLRGPLDRLGKGKGTTLPKIEGLTPLSKLIEQTKQDASANAAAVGGGTYNHKYGDVKLHTTLHGAAFKKPTVVLLSQLGQRLGGEADRQWRAAVASALSQASSSSKRQQQQPVASGKSPSNLAKSPIQFMSLRSLDVQSYKWVHRLYVRRFAQSLEKQQQQQQQSDTTTPGATSSSASAQVSPPWSVEDTTYIGSGIFNPFFQPPFCLRNYLLPTVLLVDHQGRVRWMSGGLPDAAEKKSLPLLLGELELEYFKGRRE